MAKGIYFGVNGVARKAKKIYFGVGGVARKVKKIYFGVNGSPRLAYSSGLNSGVATSLSTARQRFASASVGNTGNNLVFASGMYHSYGNTILPRTTEAYDINLTRTIISDLAEPSTELTGTNNNQYALFAGGYRLRESDNAEMQSSHVLAYDLSLVQHYVTALYDLVSRSGGAPVGGYAVFYGGKKNNGTSSWYRNAYDSNLTRNATSIDSINPRVDMASANNSSYAFFAGGLDIATRLATNLAFDANLTALFPSNLSVARSHCKGARINNYILIAGGMINNFTHSNAVDVYDPYLTKVASNISLSVARAFFESASLSEYAIYAGGMSSADATIYNNTADIFDANLTLDTVTLSSARAWLSGGVVGKYALFAGGCTSSTVESAVVDYFEV